MEQLNAKQEMHHRLDLVEANFLLLGDQFDATDFPQAHAYITYQQAKNDHRVVPVASRDEVDKVISYLKDELGVTGIDVRHKRPPADGSYFLQPQIRRRAIGRQIDCHDRDYDLRVEEYARDFLGIISGLNQGYFVGMYLDMLTVQFRSDDRYNTYTSISVSGDQFFRDCKLPDSIWFRTEMSSGLEIPKDLTSHRTAKLLNHLFWTDKRYPFDAKRDAEVRDYFAQSMAARRVNEGFFYSQGQLLQQRAGGAVAYTGPLEDYNLDTDIHITLDVGGEHYSLPEVYTYPVDRAPHLRELPAGAKLLIEFMPHTDVSLSFIHPAVSASQAHLLIWKWHTRLMRKLQTAQKIIYG